MEISQSEWQQTAQCLINKTLRDPVNRTPETLATYVSAFVGGNVKPSELLQYIKTIPEYDSLEEMVEA